MADNVAITAGSGTTIAADEVTDGTLGTVKVQFMKIMDGALDGTAKLQILAEDLASVSGDTGIMALAKRTDTPANASGTDGDYEPLQVSNGLLWTAPLGFPKTVKIDVTRPADTAAYAVGDAISDSTSAPTSGGFTISGAVRKSGGSAFLTDVCVATSNDPATRLAGEIFIFDQSTTNVNDNTAFGVSDSEIKNCLAVIPFSFFDAGNNGFCQLTGLSVFCTASGSANLRFLLRARNAYTPANAEVFSFTFKFLQID